MADVAIVIGHHPDAPGANLSLGGFSISEYDLWRPFAHELVRTFTCGAEVIERPNQQPDEELARAINETDAECAVELHFNSFRSTDAQGTEMLHWHSSSQGKALARDLHERTVEALGTRQRGLKPRMRSDRGGAFLGMTEMPAVVCEPAFGSNPSDAWKLLSRQADLMRAYRNAILEWLNHD